MRGVGGECERGGEDVGGEVRMWEGRMRGEDERDSSLRFVNGVFICYNHTY